MNWRNIPSLYALRAFEAVARAKSFSDAARDLNVTEAAMRQHVRGLEQWFDTKLAERSGKGLALTESGERLAVITSESFQTLSNGLASFAASEEERAVTVSLTPAFAETWLMPRLDQFWAEHPDIEVNLAPSLKFVDLRAGNFDMAIRYGLGNWPGLEVDQIASAEYVVVAKPGLANANADDAPDALRTHTWLFETSRQEHRDWATQHNIDFDAPTNRHYPTNSLVLAAARAGHGVSLQARALVQMDLELGVLEELYSEASDPLAYYLVAHSKLRPKAMTFANWLFKQSE